MTFTEAEQKQHREIFIKECRQKAWNAACHAEWISKQLDDVLANFTKLKSEGGKLEEEINTFSKALDFHTKDNRDKRKTLQERRNVIAKQMEAIGQNHVQGQRVLKELYASVESNLDLAKHAETWEWKENESPSR